jgi:hypothetical protein
LIGTEEADKTDNQHSVVWQNIAVKLKSLEVRINCPNDTGIKGWKSYQQKL